MIREHLFDRRAPADPLFRWRGGEVSRIEGFSDGVFAVTVSLLVFSSAVPKTFLEMWRTARDLPVFLVSFGLLVMAWQYHYQFFRRYGLADLTTLVLNAAFLFLVLFFAYPLKFLAGFLWSLVLGEGTGALFAVPGGFVSDHPWLADEIGQRVGMMAFYGLGLVGVFGVLALMVGHAYRLRTTLELDELERHLTLVALGHHLVMVVVGGLSLLVLQATGNPGISGIVYFALFPLHTTLGVLGGRRSRAIRGRLLQSSEPAEV